MSFYIFSRVSSEFARLRALLEVILSFCILGGVILLDCTEQDEIIPQLRNILK